MRKQYGGTQQAAPQDDVPECRITVTVNGEQRMVDVEPRVLLAHLLREGLGLTGTHIGCDTTSCGACTVLVDGTPVKSCTMLAVQADGRSVTTVEGIATTQQLHRCRRASRRNTGCSAVLHPGDDAQRRRAAGTQPDPTEDEVRWRCRATCVAAPATRTS